MKLPREPIRQWGRLGDGADEGRHVVQTESVILPVKLAARLRIGREHCAGSQAPQPIVSVAVWGVLSAELPT